MAVSPPWLAPNPSNIAPDMTQLLASLARPASIDGAALLRHLLFVAIVLLFWISLNPFNDLASVRVIELSREADPVKPLVYLALGATCLLAALLIGFDKFRPLWCWPYLGVVGTLAASVLFSQSFGQSAPRAVLAGIVLIAGAVAILLPVSERAFRGLLALSAVVLLVLCYAGAWFAPELSIHQHTDIFEPEHDGSWRGVFAHKNIAGPIIGVCVFIGIYAMRSGGLAVLGGLMIVAAAGGFLVMTDSKTPIGTLPVVLMLTGLAALMPSKRLALLVLAGPLALAITVTTLAGVVPGVMRPILTAIMPDPTFTGRTFIWTFVMDAVAQKPLFGHGFMAFWRTDDLTGTELFGDGSWVAQAFHAHNNFFEMAVTMGLPALAFGFVAFIIMPLRDYFTAIDVPEQRSMAMFCLQVWLFGALNSCFESFFLTEGPVWFTFLLAILGLRYLASARLA
jgi:O-antigen ligase